MANTLKFGAGNWATKEGSTLAYNDLNSNFKPLPFTFTRASSATVVNKAGLIETVGNGIPRIDFLGNTQGALKLEPQRTNLITQSEAFDNSYWTKNGASIQGDPSTAGSELVTDGNFSSSTYWGGTNVTVASGVATFNGTNGQESTLFQQNVAISTTGGTLHALTYTVTSNSLQGSANFYVGLRTNNECIRSFNIPMTVGTHTVYGNSVGTGNGFSLHTSVGFTSGSLVIDNVSVKEVQGFTSLDGTNNAYKLVEGTSNSIHRMYQTATVSASPNASISIYVKYNGRKFVLMRIADSTVGRWYDIENGVLGGIYQGTPNNSSIESVGNGWYRISISHTVSSVARLEMWVSDTESTSAYQGNGTSGVYIYGAQLEVGSYSTSLIKTQGSAVTRLKDTCSQTTPSGVIGQTEGTIFAEIDYTPHSINYESIASLQGTSTQQYIEFYFESNNKLGVGIYNGGAVQLSFTSAVQTKGIKKIAIAYKSNDFAIYLNGTQLHTDNSGSVPLLSSLGLGMNLAGSNYQLSQPIKQFQLYNTRLSNSELATLTQV